MDLSEVISIYVALAPVRNGGTNPHPLVRVRICLFSFQWVSFLKRGLSMSNVVSVLRKQELVVGNRLREQFTSLSDFGVCGCSCRQTSLNEKQLDHWLPASATKYDRVTVPDQRRRGEIEADDEE